MSDEFDYDSILSDIASQFDEDLHIVETALQPAVLQPPAPPSAALQPAAPPPAAPLPVAALADVGNLGRLAMFGNRPQVKRRSQLRREAEAAATASTTTEKRKEPVSVTRPGKQTPPVRSTPVKTSRGPTPVRIARPTPDKFIRGSTPVNRGTAPVNRGTTPNRIVSGPTTDRTTRGPTPKTTDRTSRDRVRSDGPVTRSMANAGSGALMIPSQSEFVKGIKERQRSCSSVCRVPSTTIQAAASLRSENKAVPLMKRSGSASSTTRAPMVVQRSASATRAGPPIRPPVPVLSRAPNLPVRVAAAARDGMRKPVVVKQSPGVAFGSAVSKEVRVPYQQRLRGTPSSDMTPKKTVQLRVYPGPSGTTPMIRPLTVPQTPLLMQNQRKSGHTTQTNVFERLARPTVRTPAPPTRNGVPNTFSHGIRVPTIKRSRDGSASSQNKTTDV